MDAENMKDEGMQAEGGETTESTVNAGAAAEEMEFESKLAEAEAKAAENLDGWQRAQAEFANYKKRVSREQEQISADARGRVMKRYLEVLDDLDLALKNRPQEGSGADWAQGIELIQRKLLSFLESEGVLKMDPLGQVFDANMHEAVTQEESAEYESGTVSEVLRPGYTLGERVLRPATVKVAK
jgi:molecular chaperone GrpE